MILETGYNKKCNSLLLLCAIILQDVAIMVLHNFLSFTTLRILCTVTTPPRTTSMAHLHKIISRLLAVSIFGISCECQIAKFFSSIIFNSLLLIVIQVNISFTFFFIYLSAICSVRKRSFSFLWTFFIKKQRW